MTNQAVTGVLQQFSLAGRTAIVTGAGTGLGYAMAEGLAEAGADVVVVGRRAERLQSIAEAVRALGRQALPVACDVSDRAAVEQLFRETVARFGKVDIVVNNAGITRRAPAVEF